MTASGTTLNRSTRKWFNLKHVLRNMASLAMQRLVQRLAGLTSLYFVVRHLSQENLGNYQFATVALATVVFTALPGLDNAVMQAASRGSLGLYRRATAFSLRFSLAGSLLLICAALVLRVHRPEIVSLLLVTAAFFPMYTALAQWKSVLVGQMQFSRLAAIESLTAVLTHGGLISAVLLDIRQVAVFLILFLLPGSLVNVATTLTYWQRTAPTGTEEDTTALFRYGLHTSAVTVISMIAEQIERIVIYLLISPAMLAIYLAGDRLSELVRSIFQDAASVLASRFARMATYEGRIQRTIWWICAVAGAGLLFFAFAIAPTVLLWMFGHAYAPSIPYAQALLCSVAAGNVGQIQFRFIRSQLDSESFRNITLMTSGVRILAGVGLVWAFGVWGAVATIFIHRTAISIMSSVTIRRRYQTGRVPDAAYG